MYVDRDIDRLMPRTQHRPLVTGARHAASGPDLRRGPRGRGLRRAVGPGQPAVGRPGPGRHPLLRLRLHAVAEADLDPEHRDRRRRRGRARAGRLGGGDRQPGVGAGRAVRRHLLLDAAPLLGPRPSATPTTTGPPTCRCCPPCRPSRSPAAGCSATRSCCAGLSLVRGAGGRRRAGSTPGPPSCSAPSSCGRWSTCAATRRPRRAMGVFGYSITYVTLLFGALAVDTLVRNGL